MTAAKDGRLCSATLFPLSWLRQSLESACELQDEVGTHTASINPGAEEQTDREAYPESIACGQGRVIIGDGD